MRRAAGPHPGSRQHIGPAHLQAQGSVSGTKLLRWMLICCLVISAGLWISSWLLLDTRTDGMLRSALSEQRQQHGQGLNRQMGSDFYQEEYGLDSSTAEDDLLAAAQMTTEANLEQEEREQQEAAETEHGGVDKAAAAAAKVNTGGGGKTRLRTPVWWFAPFFSGGGYSSEAVSFALGLYRSGLVEQRNVWISQHGDAFDEEVMNGYSDADKDDLWAMSGQANFALAREAIIVCHSEPGAWALPKGLFETTSCPPDPSESLYKIGRTMFETDRLSHVHVERCNKMDEVWVPTDFHKKVFAASGVRASKLRVLGEAVDSVYFDPARVTAAELPAGKLVFGPEKKEGQARDYRFLSVFKWEPRKGWDVLLAAYLTEFSATDNVALFLKTMPYHSSSDFDVQMREWASKQLGLGDSQLRSLPRLYVISEHVPQEKLPGLYKAADAFVLPSRGEGWGRPHVEAMSMELPVIATNWSGPTAFLDESNGYPLPVDGLVPLPENSPFKGHKWAQPSVAELRRLMRHVYTHQKEAAAKGKMARQDMRRRFSPSVLASQILDRLVAIEALLQGNMAMV